MQHTYTMTSRAVLYKRGLAAAVAAHDLKLLSEKRGRPISAVREIAERSKYRVVKCELRKLALDAETDGAKNVPKRELRAMVMHQRQRVRRNRHELAAIHTTGGARAEQLRQIRALSAWLKRSDPRK